MVLSSNQSKSERLLLSLFSERDIKRKKEEEEKHTNILCGDCGVGSMQIQEKAIQVTLRTEMIPLTSNKLEVESSSIFLVSYTNRGPGIF